jgi:hypothetical protein
MKKREISALVATAGCIPLGALLVDLAFAPILTPYGHALLYSGMALVLIGLIVPIVLFFTAEKGDFLFHKPIFKRPLAAKAGNGKTTRAPISELCARADGLLDICGERRLSPRDNRAYAFSKAVTQAVVDCKFILWGRERGAGNLIVIRPESLSNKTLNLCAGFDLKPNAQTNTDMLAIPPNRPEYHDLHIELELSLAWLAAEGRAEFEKNLVS